MRLKIAFLTLTAAAMFSASLQADSLLRPLLPAAQPVEAIATEIAHDAARNHEAGIWRKRWAVSLAPLATAQALDAASSYGMRELNPLLAGPDGGFGMKATSIKFGAIAGLVGAEYLLVKKYPRSAKFFTVVNWTTAGATSAFAVHNYRLPGR
jgi:hypothetical protein